MVRGGVGDRGRNGVHPAVDREKLKLVRDVYVVAIVEATVRRPRATSWVFRIGA